MAGRKIVIEDQKRDYELNADDVVEYAKLIGIDVENERHLMWIAERGIAANLPEHWMLVSDGEGQIIYSNVKTGEKSWLHPLDNEYSNLVVKERMKNSPSYDFRPESRLSSLSDAPPLSSSGKTTPNALKPLKSGVDLSEKKLDFGHFENRRGTKLAPVKLGTLKVPASSSQRNASGMSFMPKGSSLAKNIRRVNEQEQELSGSRFPNKSQLVTSPDDLNESANSDDGSKYFYEESEDEVEKSYDDMIPSDMGSHFSPAHSAGDSPKALAIDSLVQMSGKPPAKFDAGTRKLPLRSLNEETSHLAIRNTAQLSALKPLQQPQQKKASPKKYKKTKKTLKLSSNQDDTDDDLDYKITRLNEEQRLRFESIQKEWSAMQEELTREEKAKFDRMVKESSKKFEDQEALLKKENTSRLSVLKSELAEKLSQEESSCATSIAEIKKRNEVKYNEEELNFKKRIESLNETFTGKVEKLDEKHQQEMNEKKKQLDFLNNTLKEELDAIQSVQKENVKNIKEAHATEIALIENAHKEKVKKLQDNSNVQNGEVNCEESSHIQSELQEMKTLLEKKVKEHQELQDKLNILAQKASTQQKLLTELEEKSNKAQLCYEEIQDEVDKTEADLDLLRSEKTGLISELNILKENINKEKSNLVKEKRTEAKKNDVVHIGINTDDFTATTSTKSSQTCVEFKNVSCQIEVDPVLKREVHTQTIVQKKIEVSDLSCQVNLMQQKSASSYNIDEKVSTKAASGNGYVNEMIDSPVDEVNSDAFLKTVLENALVKMNNKMEERFKLLEEKLGSFDKNTSSPSKDSPTNFHHLRDAPTEVLTAFPDNHRDNHQNNHHNVIKSNSMLNSSSIPNRTNTRSCSCDRGDSGSCDIMQDVKNSVYRLNDILNTSYVPSPLNSVITNTSVGYSSPLESFYSQFRQLQERYRVKELKYQLQSGSIKKIGSHINSDTSYFNDFNSRGHGAIPHSLDLNTYPGDPTTRARNLVLREQARSWKQQQHYLSSSDMQGLVPLERSYLNLSMSDNPSPSPSRISSGLSEQSPAFQYPFLKFEPDPETEYNEWMTRLKALQEKIRSHKIL